jgi:hypothetical protein
MAIGGLDASALAGPFMGMLKGLMYGLMFILPAALLMGVYMFIKKGRKYNVEVDLIVQTSDNLVRARDKGGIIKANDVERFILQKRKKSIPIPERKYWMVNENGKFTITLFKYGEDDFAPIKITSLKQLIKRNEFTEEELEAIPELGDYKELDIKNDLNKISSNPRFIAIPSDAKSHHLVNSKLLRIRNQQTKSLERFMPIIQMGMAVILVFLIMFYGYQFAQSNIDKAVKTNQGCLEESKSILSKIEVSCLDKKLGGAANPDLVPNPPSG